MEKERIEWENKVAQLYDAQIVSLTLDRYTVLYINKRLEDAEEMNAWYSKRCVWYLRELDKLNRLVREKQ